MLSKGSDLIETLIKSQDDFGDTISHSYEGKKTLNTKCGAFYTMIMKAFLVLVVYQYVELIRNKQNQNVQVSEIHYDLSKFDTIDVSDVMSEFAFGI